MTTATWAPPPIWTVPRTWNGARCFVIGGGASLKGQRQQVQRIQGRIIAVKEAVLLRPDADVAFFAGEHAEVIAPPLLARYRGVSGNPIKSGLVVVRGKGHPVFPAWSKRVWRTTTHERWSDDPTMVAGFDAGTSAINLAILLGAVEIIVLGYDMTGGRWFTGEHPHPAPVPPKGDFARHLAPLPSLAADAAAKGIRIINVSPTSVVDCFERADLEAFL